VTATGAPAPPAEQLDRRQSPLAEHQRRLDPIDGGSGARRWVLDHRAPLHGYCLAASARTEAGDRLLEALQSGVGEAASASDAAR
jgi:hypothetical protein